MGPDGVPKVGKFRGTRRPPAERGAVPIRPAARRTRVMSELGAIRFASLAIALATTACGSPPPPSPSVVIVAEPASICANDGFQTSIKLTARDSQTRLTLVPDGSDPGPKALKLLWSFRGAAHQVVDGDTSAVAITVTSAGDRPLHVTLDGTNAAGGEASALVTIGITFPDATGTCPAPGSTP